MITNKQLKTLAAYKNFKNCELDNFFVVEGPKLAEEIFSSGISVEYLCATQSWLLENEKNMKNVNNIFEVNDNQLLRLSNLKRPNQVWMLISRDFTPVRLPSVPLTIALDHIQDPGNLGTIIRTVDWFGIRSIVCSFDTVSCFNQKVVQSTMGSLFRTKITYTDLQQHLSSAGLPVYGALLSGQDLRTLPAPSSDAILLIGNESRGISPDLLPLVTHQVLIPNLGNTAESLNAAVATSILVAHWLL